MLFNQMKYIFLGLFLVGCTTTTPTEPTLIATLFPQYSLANSLAGDLMQIEWLVPAGVDPHEYEPSPSQRLALNQADVILFSSESFEPWIHSIEDTVEGKLIDLSSYVTLLAPTTDHDDESENSLIEDEHDHGDIDPHYWVDPGNGLLMLDAIADELITLLPQHELLINTRQTLIEEALLDTISLYKTLVPENEELDIVFSGHNALGYLVNYDIHVLTPYPGFSSDAVPTAQSIIDFQNLMTTLNTNLLYVSSTDNVAVTQTLLESNPSLETVTIYTMETISEAQLQAEVSYQELLLLNYEGIAQSEK